MTKQIPLAEVTFHKSIDPNGKLFWWNGGPYRAIPRHHAAFTRRLFERGIVARMVDSGLLIPTELTDWTLKDYALVLRHHKVPFESRAAEWNAPMYRDAALALLDLEIELERHGLMLQDGHCWNTLFDGYHPCFVDFCSIVPLIGTPVWQSENEFHHWFVEPLRLMSAGNHHDMRSGLIPAKTPAAAHDRRAATAGAKVRELARAVIPPPAHANLKRKQKWAQRNLIPRQRSASDQRTARLAHLRETVADITFPVQDVFPAIPDNPAKQAVVRQLLTRLVPLSVLDLSGSGEFARLTAQSGVSAAAFVSSEGDSERLYAEASATSLALLPVRPLAHADEEAGGWMEMGDRLAERYRADLVLALGDWSVSSHYDPVQALERVLQFTQRSALIEGDFQPEVLDAQFSRIEMIHAVNGCAPLFLCER